MKVALITKFLQVAKTCKELGNYATCLSIKEGLDHILIRYTRVSESIQRNQLLI